MEFSRQEYWSGLPLPSPGDLPNPGIESGSPTLQADSLPFEPPRKPINSGGIPNLQFWVQKEMATHSSILTWRIPGTEEPLGLPSMGLHRIGHDSSDLAAAAAIVSYRRNPT